GRQLEQLVKSEPRGLHQPAGEPRARGADPAQCPAPRAGTDADAPGDLAVGRTAPFLLEPLVDFTADLDGWRHADDLPCVNATHSSPAHVARAIPTRATYEARET